MSKKIEKSKPEGQKSSMNEKKLSLQERIEIFYEKNRTYINYGFSALLIIIGGYFGYRYFIIMPMEKEASSEIRHAQYYFELDSLDLALYGRQGEFLGFADIAEDYSNTTTGNLAKYYAGITLLHQGNYNEALFFLKSFKTKSKLFRPLAYGAIGDAYSQLGDYNKAGKYYIRAAKRNQNLLTTPTFYMKAGIVFEETGKFKDALSAYDVIKNDYPDSEEAHQIEKNIARVEMHLQSSGN